MATNKRKDAAALFELIDQSTLKVPKNAGQLRIPSWWSSKTNPPSPAKPTEPPEDLPDAPAAEQETLPADPPAAPAAETPVAPPTAPAEPISSGPITQGLFGPEDTQPAEAPPAPPTAATVKVTIATGPKPLNGTATTSPATTSPATTSPAAQAPAAKPAPAASKPKDNANPPSIRPPARPAPVMPARRPTAVFAPATRDPRLIGGGAPRPVWMLAGAGIGCVALLVLVVWGMKGPKPTPAQGQGVQIVDPGRKPGTDLRFANDDTRPKPPVKPEVKPSIKPPDPPPPPHKGQIVPWAQIQRQPGLYYLLIVAGRPDVAAANARYLAEAGIDVTIKPQSNGLGSVQSVEGFTRRDDPRTDALLKRVIELGRQHPDARKTHHGVYDTAYYSKAR